MGQAVIAPAGRGGAGAREVDLDRVWLGIAAQVRLRRPGLVERFAGRLLRSAGLARALVITPSLLLGWVIATAVVLAAGAAVTLGTGAACGLVCSRARGCGHRVRVRAGDRPGLGVVVQHGGQRPDGAAGAGASGVRG
jgi:hypothetical protein